MIAKITPPLHELIVPIESLHLDPANARKGHNVEMIAASLNQYGQRTPIVVNANEGNKIMKGNGTYRAAQQLGWSHIAAVVVEDDATTAVGYAIADNRASELSEWDNEALATLLQSIDLDEIVTGFTDDDLQAILGDIEAGLGLDMGEGDA
jgi:ParB-like chromosome segregation protein Spo0J